MRKLAEKGADARTDTGVTPLIMAVYYDRVAVVKLLLAHGADANIRDDDGCSPLYYACQKGND